MLAIGVIAGNRNHHRFAMDAITGAEFSVMTFTLKKRERVAFCFSRKTTEPSFFDGSLATLTGDETIFVSQNAFIVSRSRTTEEGC